MTSVNDIETAMPQRYDVDGMGSHYPSTGGSFYFVDEVDPLVADLRAYAEQRDKRVAELDAQLAECVQQSAAWAAKAGKADAKVSQPVGTVVAALQKIAKNEKEVFDEDEGCNVLVSMGAEEMTEIARAALAAQTAAPVAARAAPLDISGLDRWNHVEGESWRDEDGDWVEFDKLQALIDAQTAPAAPLDISGLTRWNRYDSDMWESAAGPWVRFDDVRALIRRGS